MPNLTEIIDIIILGTAITGLVISILKLKTRVKDKNEKIDDPNI